MYTHIAGHFTSPFFSIYFTFNSSINIFLNFVDHLRKVVALHTIAINNKSRQD